MVIINPATEDVIGEIADDSEESVNVKWRFLKAGQKEWQKLPLAGRVGIIMRFSQLLKQQAEQLAATLTAEAGKPLQQSRNEIAGAQARIGWLADNAEKYLSDETMTLLDGLEE